MNVPETKQIVRLLLVLCPARAPNIDAAFASAWAAALEPYSFADVKAAALEHARKKAVFPAVSDLTRACRPQADAMQRRGEKRDDLELAEKLFGDPEQLPPPL